MPSPKDKYIYFEPFTEEEVNITDQSAARKGQTFQTNTNLLVVQMTSRMIEMARNINREDVKKAELAVEQAKAIYREAVEMEDVAIKLMGMQRKKTNETPEKLIHLPAAQREAAGAGAKPVITKEAPQRIIKDNPRSNTVYVPFDTQRQSLANITKDDKQAVLVITGHGSNLDTSPMMYMDKRAATRVSKAEHNMSASNDCGLSADELVLRLEKSGFNGQPSIIKLNMCFGAKAPDDTTVKKNSYANDLAIAIREKWPNVTVIGYKQIVSPYSHQEIALRMPITDSKVLSDEIFMVPGGDNPRHKFIKVINKEGEITQEEVEDGIIKKFKIHPTVLTGRRLSNERVIYPSLIEQYIIKTIEQLPEGISAEYIATIFRYGINNYHKDSESITNEEIKAVLNFRNLQPIYGDDIATKISTIASNLPDSPRHSSTP